MEEEAKFIVHIDYPRMKYLGTLHQEADDRFLNLEIETETKLPNSFFIELEGLITKHLVSQPAPSGDKSAV